MTTPLSQILFLLCWVFAALWLPLLFMRPLSGLLAFGFAMESGGLAILVQVEAQS